MVRSPARRGRGVTAAFMLGLSVVAASIACGGTDDAPPLPVTPDYGGGEGGLRIGADVVEADDAVVGEGSILFPRDRCDEMKEKQGGFIVGEAGGPNSGNPEGFIVKVVGVTCDENGTHVETAPGTIPDAFEKFSFAEQLLKGEFSFDCGKELFNYSGNATTTDGRQIPFTAKATLQCGLSFKLDHQLSADFKFPKLNSLHVGATGNADAKLMVAIDVELGATVDDATRADLAGKVLTKSYVGDVLDQNKQLGSIGLGPVKLPITNGYKAQLACDFAFTAPTTLQAGGEAKGTMQAGFVYEAGKLRPEFSKSLTVTPTPPTFAQGGLLRAECTLTPSIGIKFFGMAAAEIGAKASAGIGAVGSCGTSTPSPASVERTTSGDARASMSASISAKLDIFKIIKWQKACTLFSESISATYSRNYTVAGSTECSPITTPALSPVETANPEACFGDDGGSGDGGDAGPIPGTCTHDVCTAGEKLGQACDECTQKVCEIDPYCCDTYWGMSCFANVQKVCGRTCQTPSN